MSYALETDEREEVFVTLSACHDFLQRADSEIFYWKWVFIALHNAVQGAMVVALRRSDGFGPIREDIERKWFEHYHKTGESKPIEERLLRFLELYEKIKTAGKIESYEPTVYEPPGNQDWAMTKLNKIRNEFIHFTPKGWHLDLTGASDLCLTILDLPKFLVERCPGFILHQHLTREGYLQHLAGIEDSLTTLKLKNA